MQIFNPEGNAVKMKADSADMVSVKRDSADSCRHDYFSYFAHLHFVCQYVLIFVSPAGSKVSEVPESVNAADVAAVS